MEAGADLRSFVDRHKFGPLHEYDAGEWKRAPRPIVVLVVEQTLLEAQKVTLMELSALYCGEIGFGWIAAKRSRGLLAEFGRTRADLPFLVAASNDSECYYSPRGEPGMRSGLGLSKSSENRIIRAVRSSVSERGSN
jgi:hypothetical protein